MPTAAAPLTLSRLQMEKEMALPSAHQQNPDCDMWAHEYFTPSWFCLPDNRSVLTVVRPGDSARDTLDGVCKVRSPGVTSAAGDGGPDRAPRGARRAAASPPLCGAFGMWEL